IPRRCFQIEGEPSSPQDTSNNDDPDDIFTLLSGDPVHVEEALESKE
ncbi:hypothetical protein Tco_1471311, partial [Tanacetum coccineum]